MADSDVQEEGVRAQDPPTAAPAATEEAAPITAAEAAAATGGDDDDGDDGLLAGRKLSKKELKKLRATKRRQQVVAAERNATLRDPDGLPVKLPSHYRQLCTQFIERIDPCRVRVKHGMVPNMKTDGVVYASDKLLDLLLDELVGGDGPMLPALRQVANVASIPGIIGHSLAMPDIHCGYGFAIGNVCAVDLDSPDACVSPGGVGFDINCGVRLLRTNLTEEDIPEGKVRNKLAEALFRSIPAGVGSGSSVEITMKELSAALANGMAWLKERKLIWDEDADYVEEGGCMPHADPDKVSVRAKKRGLHQLGSLGSGNHYAEVQVVDEIIDAEGARAMGITKVGQVCVMIHSGSRGLGHQVCTDALQQCDAYVKKHNLDLNDRQLAYVPFESEQGKDYIAAMSAAANFSFCNRSLMAMHARSAFESVMGKSARDMDMHIVYDVAHNIAKLEEHEVDGATKRVLVHRKGATRAFGPGHPRLPEVYRPVGQPVLIGGSMGTASWILLGTETAMKETFGSTCHGAGRVLARGKAMKKLDSAEIMRELKERGIALKVTSQKQVAEEAAEAYKDVDEVVETCHAAGISRKCVRLRPIIVVKG